MPTRPFVDLIFAEFAPDLGGSPRPENPAYLTDAVGVRSSPVGWKSQPAFTSFGVAAGSASPLGTSAVVADGAEFLVIADTSKIYNSLNSGASWTDRTLTGVSAGAQIMEWYDGTYLQTLLFDINGMHYKQSGSAAAFVTLPGTLYPTGARPAGVNFGARIQQHFVVAYINTGFDTLKYNVYWPAIGSISDWPISGTSNALSKESGSQQMNGEFGVIGGLVGGEKFGVVAQTHAMTRMTYVGGSTVFEFDTFEKKRGCGRSSTMTGAGFVPFIQTGPNIFMWANETGVHETDGYTVNTISKGQIEEALYLNFLSHPDGGLGVSGRAVLDERRGEVIFKMNAGSGANHHLAYNLRSRSFSIASGTDYHILFAGPDSSSTAVPTVYSFNTDRKLYKRTAASGSIALQTAYLELDPGYKTQITGAHLLGAGVPGSLALAHKSTSLLSAVDVAQTGFTTMTANPRGMKAADRTTDQFHAFRVTGTGSEAQLIKGIRVYFERGEPAT